MTALDGSIVDSLDVGVCVCDPSGRVVAANALMHELLGVPEGALVGLDSGQVEIYDLDLQRLNRMDHPVLRAARDARPVRDQVVGVHGRARRIWLRMSAIPRLDESGKITEIITTAVDVTRTLDVARMRHVELADTETSEQLYRAVIEAMSEGVVVHAPDGHIIAANPAACRILGLTLEQLMGRSPLDPRWSLVDGTGSPLPPGEIPSEITRVTGTPCQSSQLGVSRPDGEQRWLSVNTMPVGGGGNRHVVVTITDVTEARRLADQMRNRQRLEAIGDLSAGVAHNFNNLLAVIVPSLELAMRDTDTTTRNRTLGEALSAAFAGADLVSRLLRVVRRDGGEVRDVIDCTKVVADVADVCRRTFDRRIEVVTEISAAPVYTRIRASDLQQVLLNLCINARDAVAGIEHPRLEIAMVNTASFVEIRVSDNGHGMTDEVQQRLGDLFFTTKGPQHGTGLGIATAMSALRDVNGLLTWTSRPGQGATLIVRLPAISDRPAPADAQEALPKVRLPACEVLVVDDDDQVRRVLKSVIEALGLQVTMAEDGARAVELVKASPTRFAAALLDLSMPGLPGDRVLVQLHEIAPALGVIVMTGFLSTSVEITGAAAVLRKPFGERAIEEALALVLTPPTGDVPASARAR